MSETSVLTTQAPVLWSLAWISSGLPPVFLMKARTRQLSLLSDHHDEENDDEEEEEADDDDE